MDLLFHVFMAPGAHRAGKFLRELFIAMKIPRGNRGPRGWLDASIPTVDSARPVPDGDLVEAHSVEGVVFASRVQWIRSDHVVSSSSNLQFLLLSVTNFGG